MISGSTAFGVHALTPYVREVVALAGSIVKDHPGSIRFTGYLHHDRDLPAWFQSATFLASPSIFQEPFGLVNAEAMACATPVLGSKRGGIPEVLGDTGLLIDPEDIAGFGCDVDVAGRSRVHSQTWARGTSALPGNVRLAGRGSALEFLAAQRSHGQH